MCNGKQAQYMLNIYLSLSHHGLVTLHGNWDGCTAHHSTRTFGFHKVSVVWISPGSTSSGAACAANATITAVHTAATTTLGRAVNA